MGYPILQGQTAQAIVFFMTDSGDHISGKALLSPTVTISKNGGSFATPAGAVSEIANGWYQIAGNATDAATLGPLLIHATSAGADPFDDCFPVVAYNPQDAAALGLTDIDATISSRLATSGYTVPPTAAANAQALLKFDMSTISGEASKSPINCLRKLRDWSISSTTLTVYKEDGTTPAYTQTLTATAGADPITAITG